MAHRIGFDVTAALSQGGGIGRYTRELIHALAQQDESFEYRLFSARPPANLPVPDSLPVAPHITHHPAPFDERWLYRIWYRANVPMPVQFFTGPIDLYHSPDFVLPPVSGNIPSILTVHDLSFVHYPDAYLPQLVTYLNRVVPRSVSRATHILADSQSTKHDLAAIWHVPAEKVTVLYSGVNDRFRKITDVTTLESLRRRYVLGQSPYILTVGTVQPRKNYELLVRAFSRVAHRVPHSLVIAGGKGWLFEGLLAEIARLNLTERVLLIGFVDDGDLPALYSAADLFVFPTIYEGFGLPLLEAMACGTPVISSNASSLPEVARHGDELSAVLLSPVDEEGWADAIVGLLMDEKARSSLIESGFRQVTRFSWQQTATQLLSLYHALLAT